MTESKDFPYRIEPLGTRHDRKGFSCGIEALDRSLRTQAGQDLRRRVAACFVLATEGSATVAGFYTLSAASVSLAELPPGIAKKLPRYPVVPAILMGRLAVDSRYQGQGLGEILLMDAFSRCLKAEIASFAFLVDAKDDRAMSYYRRFGFRRLSTSGRRLFLPMAEIAGLFA